MFNRLRARPRATDPRIASTGHIGFKVRPALPSHQGIQDLIAYCAPRLDSLGRLPRAALDPNDLVTALSHLFIAEPIGQTWRYRLVGTGIVGRVGYEFTGKSLDEIYTTATAIATNKAYTSIARHPRIVNLVGHYLGVDLDHAPVEVVHIPMLARDGHTVWVFGGAYFFDNEEPQPLRYR